MGTIERAPLGADGKTRAKPFVARWYDNTLGRSTKRAFASEGEARAHISKVELDKYQGTYVSERTGRTPLKVYAEAWLATLEHKPSTIRSIRSKFEKHLYPVLGPKPIGSIVHSQVLGWRNSRRKANGGTLGPGGLRMLWVWTVAMFDAAVLDKVIQASPCAQIDKAPRGEKQLRPEDMATYEELEAIYAQAPSHWRAMVPLGIRTGLRPAELWGLCIEQVDFRRMVIRVDRQLNTERREPPLVPPKTESEKVGQEIEVDDEVIAIINEHLSRHPLGPPVLNHDGKEAHLIFRAADGAGLVRPTTINGSLRRAKARAGVTKPYGMHMLRHFFASTLCAEGVRPPVVSALMRHARISETLETYTHFWPDQKDDARARVSEAFARAAAKAEARRKEAK